MKNLSFYKHIFVMSEDYMKFMAFCKLNIVIKNFIFLYSPKQLLGTLPNETIILMLPYGIYRGNKTNAVNFAHSRGIVIESVKLDKLQITEQ